jgi:hypothetical protein
MSDNMVRTQVYLPREVHATLKRRAAEEGLTLADQIRTALSEYLARTEAEEKGVRLEPDDPLFQMVGQLDSGVDDLGRNHDHYLYGATRQPASSLPIVAETKTPSYKPRARHALRGQKKTR